MHFLLTRSRQMIHIRSRVDHVYATARFNTDNSWGSLARHLTYLHDRVRPWFGLFLATVLGAIMEIYTSTNCDSPTFRQNYPLLLNSVADQLAKVRHSGHNDSPRNVGLYQVLETLNVMSMGFHFPTALAWSLGSAVTSCIRRNVPHPMLN